MEIVPEIGDTLVSGSVRPHFFICEIVTNNNGKIFNRVLFSNHYNHQEKYDRKNSVYVYGKKMVDNCLRRRILLTEKDWKCLIA